MSSELNSVLILASLVIGFSMSAFYIAKFNLLVMRRIRALNKAAKHDRKLVNLLWSVSSLYSPQVTAGSGDSYEWRKAVEACIQLRCRRTSYLIKGFLPLLLGIGTSVVLLWFRD
jgi:hypothetical protein